MTNVVQLTFPNRARTRADRLAALASAFADDRRSRGDVFWLKENAEFLNIMECTQAAPDDRALEVHRDFYDTIEKRLAFFPQYYRFLLSICLDLEDLGIGGDKGKRLVQWTADEGLAEAEMSDLQRAEARRLMLRRGVDPLASDTGLGARLMAFAGRAATFAMPNKKAAYELTHTIFYLTEYGRKSMTFGPDVTRSLSFAGTLAYLDQNADLLAEVCVAMRFAGLTPPAIWEAWITDHTDSFIVASGDRAEPGRDDYHEFLVCTWATATAGADPFARPVSFDRLSFHAAPRRSAPLRSMSQTMLDLDSRSGDWTRMRGLIANTLDRDAMAVLEEAEAACTEFDAFFAGFARAGMANPLERLTA
ncbi:hypothetical protein ATO6_22100 [Oceanicola sp. 22II-s10i]|uniref:DUF6902 family protein n=1 Tax=Oceanicola sp. 22II-s10i TaxID=1317116 RepID=UPI000B527373|nr:hypothetical protein [Oceanicola sp. 22II-s10i]OWU82321.1 hypothetical protein ATO6_22100 [Oceanicola sp. 22II-s10i]